MGITQNKEQNERMGERQKEKDKDKKGKKVTGEQNWKKDRKEEKLIITLTEKRYMHCSEVWAFIGMATK